VGYVAFVSVADDLAGTDTNGRRDVFRRDLLTQTTTLVGVNAGGTDSGNNSSSLFSRPGISADGRFVVFASDASDLVATDTNRASDLFVRDLGTATTVLVSFSRLGNALSQTATDDLAKPCAIWQDW